MIGATRFFEIYSAVNLHFTAKYDFFKYGGVTRVTETTLLKRNDRFVFEKWAGKVSNEEMAVGFCVANTVADKKYIRNFDMQTYIQWVAKRDSLYYNFKEEFEKFIEEKQKTKNGLDSLVQMGFSGGLSLEFIILLNDISKNFIFEELDKTDNFVWQELKQKLVKYQPFVHKLWNIDEEKRIKLKEITHSS